MESRSPEELRDELRRLMLEHIESLEAETFVGLNQENVCLQEERLKRIREVSAAFLTALKRNARQIAVMPPGAQKVLEDTRMTEKPNVTLPGKVEKIIESEDPSEPEKAEISVEGPDPLYREIRIENSLTDEEGDEVGLKQGADVDVTVEAEKDATTAKNTPNK
jgi:hypothetical protein